jgi:TPP-dependent indolepyruvate ferredoxin oxidoreductase alpha subunit
MKERLEAATDIAFPSKEHNTLGIILSGLTTRKVIEKLSHLNFSCFL